MNTAITSKTTSPQHTPSGTQDQAGNGASFLTGLRIFSVRSLKKSFRDGESLLMAIVLPVMLLLVFTFVLGGAMAVGDGGREAYLSYVMPAIVITAAGFGASYTAVVVSQDVTTGFMNRLRTMPFPAGTVLLGHVVSSMARNLMATAVVFIVGFAVGFRTEASALQLLGSVGVIALWILVITIVFAMLGMVSGSPEAANGYGFILLFLPYISSGYAPVESMPTWLQGFAQYQPMTPVIDASRALLNGQAPGIDLAIALVWCLGFVAISVWLIAVIFPRRIAR